MTNLKGEGDDLRWFARHRQEWIAETVRVFGYINRIHIQRKFGITAAVASTDLRTFQQENPKALIYDKTGKRYASPEFEPVAGDPFP